MKVRWTLFGLMSALVIALVAFGCSPKAPTGGGTVPAGFERITIVGSSIGSASTTSVVVMAKILNKYYPEIEWSTRSGTAGATPVQITEGQVKLATSSAGLWSLAYGWDKDLKTSRLRSIHTAHPLQNITWITAKDKPWTDISQVPAGTNICPGSPGTIIPEFAKVVIEAAGRKYTDFNMLPMGKTAQADAFREGKIDITFQNIDPAIGWLYDLNSSPRGVRMFGMTPEQAEKARPVAKKMSAFVEMSTIASEYNPDIFKPGDDVLVIKIQNTVVSRDDFPEEIAYKMAKVLDEHHDELVSTWAGFKWSNAQMNVKYGDTDATRLHKGVAKYYKEKGYLPASYVARD